MKLIYIKSTMEPKNYNTIRSILKKAQGEKIAVFKMNDTQTLCMCITNPDHLQNFSSIGCFSNI